MERNHYYVALFLVLIVVIMYLQQQQQHQQQGFLANRASNVKHGATRGAVAGGVTATGLGSIPLMWLAPLGGFTLGASLPVAAGLAALGTAAGAGVGALGGLLDPGKLK